MTEVHENTLKTMLARIFRDRRLLIAAWILIVLEGAAATFLFKPWAIGDSFHYLALARNLTEGHYGVYTEAGFEADPLRPPGYPLILFFLLYGVRLPPVAVVVTQLLAYCASIYLLQRCLAKISINPIPFVVLIALYPFPLLYSTFLLTESWVILTTTVAALLFLRRSTRGYALAGAVAAVGGLIRADLLLMPILFFCIILVDSPKSDSWRRRAGKALLPLVTAGVVMLPYAAWNYAHFNVFTPLPRAGAVGTSLLLTTFQRDLTPDDVAMLDVPRYDNPHTRALGLPQTFKMIDRRIGAPLNIGGFDPYNFPTAKLRIAASKEYLRVAIGRIAERPGFYANHVIHNLWELWVTKKYAPKMASVPKIGGLIIAGLAVVNWGVFIFGMVGMVVALARPAGWTVPWALVPITWYPAGIHIWLHTEARYTAATRPFLVLFCAAFLVWVAGRYSSRPRSATNA